MRCVFLSDREWPKSICGKFVVVRETHIGILDANGKWAVDVSALAADVNTLIDSGRMRKLPLTPENIRKAIPCV